MRNPIYAQYGAPQTGGVMERFQQFKKAFTGDPRQQVQQLLNSGRISQQQYNQAVQMAKQWIKFMK